MKVSRKCWLGLLAGAAAVSMASAPASAQQPQKPNILFIMGDDIGIMQPSILSPRIDGGRNSKYRSDR